MSKFKQLIAFLIFIGLLPACSSIEVIPLRSVDEHLIENDVILYTLPKNILRVEAEISEHQFNQGPFAEYANKYLGIPDVALQDSVYFTIDHISMSIFSEPDYDQIYLIDTKNKKRIPSIQLTDEGIIQSINALGKESHSSYPKKKSKHLHSEEYTDNYLPITKGEYLKNDTAYRTITTDSTTIRVPVVSKSLVSKNTMEKAQDLAKILLEMREEKFSMLIGDLEEFPEGETFRTIMKEFDALEKEYLPLFTGSSSTRKHVIQVDVQPVHPNENANQVYPLFAFSRNKGIIDEALASDEELVYLTIYPTSQIDSLEKLYQQLDTTLREKHGVYYRIPEMVVLEVNAGNRTLIHGRTPLAQHGFIARQPINILNNKRLYIEFDTDWGNIIHIQRHRFHRAR